MEKLKVFLCAGTMPYFSEEGLLLYKKNCLDLKKLSKDYNFEFNFLETPISTKEMAEKVRKEINCNCYDFVIIFHQTYLSGDIAYELMRCNAKIGLWAAREPKADGALPLASFVCLNQNTSIAGHFFKDKKKKVKWFFGGIEDKYFKPRFEITIKVLQVIKNLSEIKIAQIGQIAEGFRNMYYDERDIFKVLGIEIVKGIEIVDVLAQAENYDNEDASAEIERIMPMFKEVNFKREKIEEAIKIYLAIKKMSEENNFKAVAFDCAKKLMPLKSMTGCLPNSLLNSAGITTGCEGDMLSTISSLILRMFSDLPTAVSDLPAFDDEDDSILLWHCGSAPFEMANNCGVNCRSVYRAEFAKGTELENLGPITDITYKESDVTVFRLTGESDAYYYFTGKIFNDKKSWFGSRGWVKNIKLYGKSIKAIDLMNTILLNNVQHHYPFVLKDIRNYLEEFAYWLDLKKIKRLDYEDFLYS